MSDSYNYNPTPAALQFKLAEAELARKNALKDALTDAGIKKSEHTTDEDIARMVRATITQHRKEAAKAAKARAEEDARAIAEIALTPAAAAAQEGLAAIQRAQFNNKDQPPQRVYWGGSGPRRSSGLAIFAARRNIELASA